MKRSIVMLLVLTVALALVAVPGIGWFTDNGHGDLGLFPYGGARGQGCWPQRVHLWPRPRRLVRYLRGIHRGRIRRRLPCQSRLQLLQGRDDVLRDGGRRIRHSARGHHGPQDQWQAILGYLRSESCGMGRPLGDHRWHRGSCERSRTGNLPRSELPSALRRTNPLRLVSELCGAHPPSVPSLIVGVHPKVIQDRLGHAPIKTTLDVYGHLYEGLDEAAADPWMRHSVGLLRTLCGFSTDCKSPYSGRDAHKPPACRGFVGGPTWT